MAKCTQCGDCCEFIAVGASLDKTRTIPDFPYRDFILKHWTPIEPPAKKLNPLMSDKQFDGYFWYKCDLFDTKTRKCKDHDNRVRRCKSYPTRGHNNKTLMSARCGFYKE